MSLVKKKWLVLVCLLFLLPLAACSVFHSTRQELYVLDRSSDEEAPSRITLALTVQGDRVIKEESEVENLHTKVENLKELADYQKDLDDDPAYGLKGYNYAVKISTDGNLVYHLTVDYQEIDFDALREAMTQKYGNQWEYQEPPKYDEFLKRIEEQGFKKVS